MVLSDQSFPTWRVQGHPPGQEAASPGGHLPGSPDGDLFPPGGKKKGVNFQTAGFNSFPPDCQSE